MATKQIPMEDTSKETHNLIYMISGFCGLIYHMIQTGQWKVIFV